MAKRAKSKRGGESSTKFVVVIAHQEVELPAPANLVVLERDRWDDHGIRSSFRVYVVEGDRLQRLGTWKIIDSDVTGERETELPREFTALPARYLSLGQEVAVYERLTRIPVARAKAILSGLRDVVYRPVPAPESIDGFQRSLIRFASANEALLRAPKLLESAGVIDRRVVERVRLRTLDLRVRAKLEGFPRSHSLTISFSDSAQAVGTGRIVVIVGPNGSGKTQLLAALARSLSGLESADATVQPEKPFNKVVVVSYGAFDHFTRPRIPGALVSYVYCGLRLPSEKTRKRRVVLDFDAAIELGIGHMTTLEESERAPAWRRALEVVELADLADETRRGRGPLRQYIQDRLSAGQKVVALTIAGLAMNLQPGAVVLHDEPETHLHPNLLAALLRAMHFLVDTFDSHAILATHSLIPVQETPAKNVVILDRFEDGSVAANPPSEQTFGSTLDELSRAVFRSGPNDQNFRMLLRALAERYSPDDIAKILGGELSLGTRVLLAGMER